jgi:hypothetical protein
MRGAAGWGGRPEKEKPAAMTFHRFEFGRRRPVLATLGLLLALAALPDAVHAACADDPAVGNWSNTTPDKGPIVVMQIRCEGDTLKVRASGSCERAICSWGETDAKKLPDGRILAVYPRGLMRHNIYASVSEDRLRAFIYTTHDGRPSSDVTNTFERQ